MGEKLFRLRDGRQLGYIEYGEKDGIPVMIFHGTPGSKLWFREDDEIAKSLGIRLIATDRPGFGTSDRKINRSLLDWALDIQELADGLGLERFSVIGVSGGGAYAAACAYSIPTRLHHVSMIASVAPFIDGKPPRTMIRENRLAFTLSKYVPWLMKYSYKIQKKMMEENPEKFIQAMKKGNKHLIESDRKIAQDDEVIKEMMAHLSEAFRLRVDGPIEEVNLLSKYWGFELNEIRIPIHIWHGEDDRMAPFEEIVKVTRGIPKAFSHFVPGAGHFLTDYETIWEDVLKQIKEDYEKHENE